MRRRKGTSITFSLVIIGLIALSPAILSLPSWGARQVDNDGDGFNSRNDCDDSNPNVNPGASEICGNNIDENCDGVVESCTACTDLDGDGYSVEGNACGLVDCDDSDPAVYPGAPEICNNNIDNNCDGFTDESCTACTDADSDNYYAEAACGPVGQALDCNDANGNINPGAAELCNGVDDNCDGQVDEGCPVADGDTDGDGLSNAIEQSGFSLVSGLLLWDDTTETWVNSPIPGSSGCGPGEKCLNPSIGDLFVIWRQLPEPPSPEPTTRIDLASCNIFEFASRTISNFTVWVLRENSVPSDTRQITPDSDQKAVVLIEDPNMYGTTGFSQPGSIMISNKGRAWIYSHQIVNNIETNCGSPVGSCVVDKVPMTNQEAECFHFKNTVAHEIWHVMGALNTADLHISEDSYIMYPATVFTQKGPNKNYTIGGDFSPAGLTDPSFR
jgi:hypothetical protein